MQQYMMFKMAQSMGPFYPLLISNLESASTNQLPQLPILIPAIPPTPHTPITSTRS